MLAKNAAYSSELAMTPQSAIIPHSHHNQRLDQALELLVPGMGRRGRMRIIQSGRVLLDGTPARKGEIVRQGQTLSLLPQEKAQETQYDVAVLAGNSDFAALHKPAGLHCQALAGAAGLSLEAMLPGLFPDRPAKLLNRLDRPTSGIVLAGFGQQAQQNYRDLEDAGSVDKVYLAVLAGALRDDCVVRNRLDVARRRVSRVQEQHDRPLRWTRLHPLLWREKGGRKMTLVLAQIRKGARHQIRAHCAHLGLPIMGDAVYGKTAATTEAKEGQEETLYLHHARIRLPDFEAACLPAWLKHWPGAEELL